MGGERSGVDADAFARLPGDRAHVRAKRRPRGDTETVRRTVRGAVFASRRGFRGVAATRAAPAGLPNAAVLSTSRSPLVSSSRRLRGGFPRASRRRRLASPFAFPSADAVHPAAVAAAVARDAVVGLEVAPLGVGTRAAGPAAGSESRAEPRRRARVEHRANGVDEPPLNLRERRRERSRHRLERLDQRRG